MDPKVSSGSVLTFYGSVMKKRHKLGVMSSCLPFALPGMSPLPLAQVQIPLSNDTTYPKPFLGNVN